MNVALIGYRGTGKSTIGRILAEELALRYINLDEEIVTLAGMSIPEIVARSTWDHFRDLEKRVVETVTGRDGQVLDTGGGVICRPENCDLLRKNAVVFLLEAEVKDIIARIRGGEHRPSLTGTKSITEEVGELLEKRTPLYRKTAHYTIDTSVRTPEEAVREITDKFRAHGRKSTNSRAKE